MKKTLIPVALTCAILAGTTSCNVVSLNTEQLLAAGMTATQAMTISDDDMAQYARASVAQLDAQNQIAPASSAYTKRLNQLTSALTDIDGLPLNFKVYLTKDINAFACPDGSIRVYSGLMDTMDDTELLGVIGHEIGHVVRHHSRNAFRQQLLNGAIGQAIASTGSVAAALSQSQLAELGQTFLSSKYSRSNELEADDFGYEFLQAAGRNPWGMVSAFEKMDAMSQSGQQSSIITRMFSSHPETSERISRLSERATKEGIKRN